MEYNLNKIKAIKGYEKKEYSWYDILEKGEHWWKFLGIIPIFKIVRKEELYRQSFSFYDEWKTKKEFVKEFRKDFWKEHYFEGDTIYCKPFLAIWIGEDRLGSSDTATINKIFDTVDELHSYKESLIKECEQRNIYLKEL